MTRRDKHPINPDARRGPSCSCCRRGKVRVAVTHGTTRPASWACPACDRVDAPDGRSDDAPLSSAPKVGAP